MTTEKWRQFFIFIIILAVLAVLAIGGMLQIFNAADEARHNVKVSQCQNIVLGDSIHNFHIAFAKIEAAEDASKKEQIFERKSLLKDAINESDITAAMKACESK